jgi:hypothetical protein
MNSEFETKLNMFFDKNDLSIGTMEELKKVRMILRYGAME